MGPIDHLRKENMSSIIKNQNNPLYRAIHRDEFLQPFDQIFDEFFKSKCPFIYTRIWCRLL